MRKLVLALLITLSCLPAQSAFESADAKPVFSPVITWAQFQSLPPESQRAYLQDLRNMLVALSVTSDWEVAQVADPNSWVWFSQLIQEAQARTPAVRPCNPGTVRRWEGRTYGCYPIKNAPACPEGQVSVHISDGNQRSCQKAPGPEGCGEGFAQFTDPDTQNTTYCLPSKDPKVITPAADSPTCGTQGLPDCSPSEEPENCWWNSKNFPNCDAVQKDLKKYRSEFYQKWKGKDALCIYAGMLSKYKDPKKPQAGQCLPVRKASVAGKSFECKKKGTVLCNPLIFGAANWEKGQGHCVKAGSQATEQCTTKTSVDEVVEQITKMGPEAEKAWNDMRKGFLNMMDFCASSPVAIDQSLFCQECKILLGRGYFSLQQAGIEFDGKTCRPLEAATSPSGQAPKKDVKPATDTGGVR